MAVLNAWQKPSRVIASDGGNGPDGILSVSSNITVSVASAGCSGSASSPTLTIDSPSTFANGDVVFIHQSRGTGVNQWEINRISSGAGSTTLTLQENLHYTYTDSGASQAQVVKMPQYSQAIVDITKTYSDWNWDTNKGGILAFMCANDVFINGTVSANGANGATVTGTSVAGTNTVGPGYHGGFGAQDNVNTSGNQGEGTIGDGGRSSATNQNGAGAGTALTAGSNPGGGGGHASTGGNGTDGDASGQNGGGGLSTGSADLTEIAFGGGGGGGGSKDSVSNTMGDGGAGAGIIVIFGRTITVTGAIAANGGVGASSSRKAHGGGGAGGSILLVGDNVIRGTNLITATGGAGGSGGTGGTGGAASAGRIATNYKTATTGTTNPSSTDVQDTSLIFPISSAAQLI